MVYYLLQELTNFCTGRCSTCITWQAQAPKGFMEPVKYPMLLEMLKHINIQHAQFNGQGEPFLHPQFDSFPDTYRYMYPNTKTTVITNGSVYRPIPDSMDYTQVSFNGGTKEVYEAITGLNFEQVISNIRKWAPILRAKGSIHFLAFDGNVHTLPFADSLFGAMNIPVEVSYKYDNQCGRIKDLTLPKYRRKRKVPCSYVEQVIYVTWDYKLVMCCHDVDRTAVYGDILKDGLVDLLEGEKRKAKLQEHRAGLFTGICEHCNFNTEDMVGA